MRPRAFIKRYVGATFAIHCTPSVSDSAQKLARTLAKAFHDLSFDAAKENKATWRGCDHQCVQD